MAYTTLRVSGGGVVLYALHLARFEADGADATDAFLDFATEAERGIYSLRWDGDALVVRPLPASRLVDGMPTRLHPTPLPADARRIPKPPPEGPYASVRLEGVATLLTSPDGAELYESCSASLLSYDGARLISAPLDRPRVRSCAEDAVIEDFAVVARPLATDDALPLLLINAVKGTCAPALPGRPAFPAELRRAIDACFERTAYRP